MTTPIEQVLTDELAYAYGKGTRGTNYPLAESAQRVLDALVDQVDAIAQAIRIHNPQGAAQTAEVAVQALLTKKPLPLPEEERLALWLLERDTRASFEGRPADRRAYLIEARNALESLGFDLAGDGEQRDREL